MPEDRSDRKNAATLPTSSIVTLRRSAEPASTCLSILEAADTGRGERLDRPGRDAVDPRAFRPEAVSQIADVGFEARLRQPHDVVVRHRPDRAEIGQRDNRALPSLHQWPRTLRECREAVRADVVRDREAFAGRPFQEIAG